GHGGGDLGDVADLAGQVRRHVVDVVGEVAPGAGDVLDLGLAAELSLGADFAGDPGDLVGEAGELVDHGVDGAPELEEVPSGGVWSALATGVVTWGMLRPWLVRLSASWLTFSVRSRQVPDTFGTPAWPPKRPSVPTSRATRVTSSAKLDSWATILFTVRPIRR